MDYSEWASPTICVRKKNNKIKACIDCFTRLNDCLETYNYLLPSPEDIFAKSSGKVFLKLNLFEVYLQIPVDKKCAKFLIINIQKKIYIDSTNCHLE